MLSKEDHNRLKEIEEEMSGLLEEFKRIVQDSDNTKVYNRFKAYPHGHIAMALNDEHMYVGNNPVTLRDIIEELEDSVESDDEIADEEEEETV